MSKVKFTVFSDLHHHPPWYKSDAPERLTAIQKRARENNAEFLLHLGDFSHKPSACPELIRQFKEFAIPGYFVLGNHEFDIDPYETVLESMGMEKGYYFFDHGGLRFVIMDDNYFREFPGVHFHYSERNYFDHSRCRTWMPPEEIQWVRETVMTSPFPCILASHTAVEYPVKPEAEMQCGKEIAQIIRDSQTIAGKVILCLNGHYHRSGLDIIDDVPRLDVNSATFNWVNKAHYLFPEKDLYLKHECYGNMIIYEKPVSAEIVIDTCEKTIEIIGMKGNFLHGISTEISGSSSGNRLCTPDMLSAKVRFP